MGNARRPSFKGHCAMCALNTDGRIRGLGWRYRMLPAERELVGKSRRVRRGEVPADQLDDALTWDSVVPEVVEIDPDWRPGEHVTVNAASTHDTEGYRLFGSPADVCRACSDFEVGRLVPVAFCAEALEDYKRTHFWEVW